MRKDLTFKKLLDDVKANRITVEKAVEEIAVFMQSEFKVFQLENLNEDIRSEIILKFLKKGPSIINRYDEKNGSFFNYLFSCIKGMARTELRSEMKKDMEDKVSIIHSIDNFSEEEEKYDFVLITEKKLITPFDYLKKSPVISKVSVKEFMKQRSYKSLSKAIVVLAMKACFDISDYDISQICYINQIDEEDFFRIVQELKKGLYKRYEKRKNFLKCRNNAYYNHRKYNITDDLFSTAGEYLQKEYKERYEKNTERWHISNEKLEKGLFHVCPSNKTIAKALCISERLVSYYIQKIRDELEGNTFNLKDLI
ncbi:MAG: hypothetical protein HUK25_02860 [Treponema sp.]|nr:hypothetical protein [Treponema sp.]